MPLIDLMYQVETGGHVFMLNDDIYCVLRLAFNCRVACYYDVLPSNCLLAH